MILSLKHLKYYNYLCLSYSVGVEFVGVKFSYFKEMVSFNVLGIFEYFCFACQTNKHPTEK